ncbi:ribosome-associated heat shock protein Hsp15 [Psittacicella hinzii]|uniref:Heat shock protein 15 n=1 Tax=Psittacicella hinzii TaxID=2028575 RepID=A0A3A1YJ75_9GAMM|nr:ribosome-associated heat shock protein Hsp15 [Psittacicella hinzii]RIY37100.1 heat-shock protein [Psittacicella hinzii]
MAKTSDADNEQQVRLDKWLHAARFYKTRSLATQMVDGGKVTYNGQRTKPSRIVELGAQITLQKGNEVITVVVQELSKQRTAYKVAKNYYEETAESVEKRQAQAEAKRLDRLSYIAPAHKPNKKERRTIQKFKIDRASYDNYDH